MMSSNPTTVPVKCLKCQAEQASPIVCTGCQTLYPVPQSADYFDLLGLPHTYAIDEDQLRAAHWAIARNIHPDRFTAQPGEVGRLATRLSAEINQAVSVLKDPVQRAGYLLEQAGGPSAAELREVPGEFLTEIMTLRERIEEARAARDGCAQARLRASLSDWRELALERVAETADQLATSTEEQRKAFRRLLNSVRYLDNLSSQLATEPLSASSETAHG